MTWWMPWAVMAAETGSDSFDLGMLAQYGVLGVAAGALAVFARIAYRREIERADRLEAEVVRLNNLVIERVIPALTAAASAAEEATQLIRDMQRERELAMLRSPTRRAREDRP